VVLLDPAKTILTLYMLLGRLELFTVLVLLTPSSGAGELLLALPFLT